MERHVRVFFCPDEKATECAFKVEVRGRPSHQRKTFYCGIEQRLAYQAHNLEVGGSNPPPATKWRDSSVGRVGASYALGRWFEPNSRYYK